MLRARWQRGHLQVLRYAWYRVDSLWMDNCPITEYGRATRNRGNRPEIRRGLRKSPVYCVHLASKIGGAATTASDLRSFRYECPHASGQVRSWGNRPAGRHPSRIRIVNSFQVHRLDFSQPGHRQTTVSRFPVYFWIFLASVAADLPWRNFLPMLPGLRAAAGDWHAGTSLVVRRRGRSWG